MKYIDLQHVLEKELIVAIGCTEPIAIAYAASVASERITGQILSMTISCSRNVIKNAMAVAIPGRAQTGIAFVAALGAIVKQSKKKLALLEDVTSVEEQAAIALCEAGKVNVKEDSTSKVLAIEVSITSANETVVVRIEDDHTNLTSIRVNDEEYLQNDYSIETQIKHSKEVEFTLDDIIAFCLNCPLSSLDIVQQSIEMNSKISEHGLNHEFGLQIGKLIQEQVRKGILADDLANTAMSYAAAGSDARMGGAVLPVMANSGSGNQGIAVTMPVIAVANKLEIDDETTLRAVAISHLIAIFIKRQFGRLSALCGVTVAGASAAAAITYLLKGTKEQMFFAIQNVLGNVAGMLCDGAKAGCAMKVSTCSGAAVQAALMASNNLCICSTNGFIEKDVHDTIRNFSKIGNEGSKMLDAIVLEQMLNKRQ